MFLFSRSCKQHPVNMHPLFKQSIHKQTDQQRKHKKASTRLQTDKYACAHKCPHTHKHIDVSSQSGNLVTQILVTFMVKCKLRDFILHGLTQFENKQQWFLSSRKPFGRNFIQVFLSANSSVSIVCFCAYSSLCVCVCVSD